MEEILKYINNKITELKYMRDRHGDMTQGEIDDWEELLTKFKKLKK